MRSACRFLAPALAAALWLTPTPHGAAGADERTVTFASVMDLSGPLGRTAVQMRNGLQMRFEEENAFGGVHGRRLRLVVEDAAGAEAARNALARLLQKERPLALVGAVGPEAVAAMAPQLGARRLPDLFPATPVAGHGTARPARFQTQPDLGDTTAVVLRYLLNVNAHRRPAILYRDDALGRELRRGFGEALKDHGLTACAEVAIGAAGRDEALARLRGGHCDLVLLAVHADETVAVLQAARQSGWYFAAVASPLVYTGEPPAEAAAVEGLYAPVTIPSPLDRPDNRLLARWVEAYQTRFGAPPGPWSVLGYVSADLVVAAAHKAGAKADGPALAAALATVSTEADFFGNPPFAFTAGAEKHSAGVRLAQVRNGRWQLVTEPLR